MTDELTSHSILDESVLSLAEAAALCPGRGAGGRLVTSTVFRWLRRGVAAADGDQVRLEGVRLGGRWVTSREALARFTARLSATPRQPRLPQSAGRRRLARERAAAELDRLGI